MKAASEFDKTEKYPTHRQLTFVHFRCFSFKIFSIWYLLVSTGFLAAALFFRKSKKNKRGNKTNHWSDAIGESCWLLQAQRLVKIVCLESGQKQNQLLTATQRISQLFFRWCRKLDFQLHQCATLLGGWFFFCFLKRCYASVKTFIGPTTWRVKNIFILQYNVPNVLHPRPFP